MSGGQAHDPARGEPDAVPCMCVCICVYIYIIQYIHVIYIHTYIYVALFALPIYKTPDKVVGVNGELFSCS